ncbi:Hsp20/alpha crystallin family protein [Flavobacterium luteum]|uniref:Hsp20/alpha crystallin family protein n=1 Tax=Flavobacterium luteum TaxID=2026654 RepID=A0A7J5AKU6_9FLAO|nr:Hsp20/alpha crystallin family protein [Flavobacterium luteum]KAB1157589.1 Hsp20/alpha crystallin family protein [Flavobacterium luteum]
MTLIKSNGNLIPFGMDNFFDDDFFDNKWLEKKLKHTLPAVNIKENKNEFNIEFAAPGFTKKDFNIDLDDNVLTISAEKEKEKNEENENFTRKEFSYNSFSRSFTLPKTVNGDKIDAKYTDGILKLSIPKMEVTKLLPKKQIKVA